MILPLRDAVQLAFSVLPDYPDCRMNGNGTGNGNRQNRQGSSKQKFVLRKAYEISYAVFRIASRVGSVALREHLERQALSLLDAAVVENHAWVNTVSRAIEYLMRFGGDVGLIHEANKETVLEELAALTLVVADTEKLMSAEPVPLDDIFSAVQEPLFRKARSSEQSRPSEQAAPKAATAVPVDDPVTGNQEIRQTAILERIRQSGNCRLRDLLEVLPDYSERTLRYDLQSLAAQNLIERIGNGGPAVFYRLRQPA
jgi:DeoR-like helix-turn-helix domain